MLKNVTICRGTCGNRSAIRLVSVAWPSLCTFERCAEIQKKRPVVSHEALCCFLFAWRSAGCNGAFCHHGDQMGAVGG